MPAYLVNHVTITDQEKFAEYMAATQAVGRKFGAKPVAIGNQPWMLNGESDGHQMVVVAEFENMETLEAWHNSDEYQAIIPLREAGSDQRQVAYETMAMPSP
ncbi:MAG: DUF1330 domain-containing protein [Boseongicola sp.]